MTYNPGYTMIIIKTANGTFADRQLRVENHDKNFQATVDKALCHVETHCLNYPLPMKLHRVLNYIRSAGYRIEIIS